MNPQIWILAAGRLLSQVGTGFTLFYAAIFFVNQVGLSATAVGIALGSQSVSGVLGRFWSGAGADSPRWGRKRMLILSAICSALADGVLAIAPNFSLLLGGNILMGLGGGLYWPATEAMVADLTRDDQRNEAFALTRMADMVGLSLGTVLAGQWIAWSGNYRLLFVLDGLSFVLFGLLIAVAITETRPAEQGQASGQQWRRALQDRILLGYCAVNVLFTGAIAQIQSTVPLYLTNFVRSGNLTPTLLSGLVTYHTVLAALLQLPVARRLNRLSRWQTLMLSMVFWGGSFLGIGLTGLSSGGAIALAILSFSLFALASITYTPSASALVVELAPEELRGIYLSLNSQCWAVGYFIGPLVGGWAMDQPAAIAHGLWLIGAVLTLFGFGWLGLLARHQATQHQQLKALVYQAARACEAKNAKAFAALFGPEGEIQLPKQQIQGRAAIATITQAYLASCGPITIEVQQVNVTGGDRAQVRWQWSEPGKQRLNQLELQFKAGQIQRWQEF